MAEWTDILDLKFEGNEETLWKELIDILKYWCRLGVDGFRMDVASTVPLQFWFVLLEKFFQWIRFFVFVLKG